MERHKSNHEVLTTGIKKSCFLEVEEDLWLNLILCSKNVSDLLPFEVPSSAFWDTLSTFLWGPIYVSIKAEDYLSWEGGLAQTAAYACKLENLRALLNLYNQIYFSSSC